ncbi:MAG: cytochrome B6, partial [Actinobacteria bacterium]|nr:cytochrome B6 [Actinomycetota bacterium]
MSRSRKAKEEFDTAPWQGKTRRYDIIKEGTIALLVVSILTVSLSLLLGSPDDTPLTFKGWAQTNSDNFYVTAVSELAGTSGTATYGPPYNDAAEGLNMGPLWLQKWAGVSRPIDTVNDFVIAPLSTQVLSVEIASALATWKAAAQTDQKTWATNYDDAIVKVEGKLSAVPAGNYGPVPALAQGLTDMAKAGGLDAALLSQGGFFQTD